jgi:hypothetical protein
LQFGENLLKNSWYIMTFKSSTMFSTKDFIEKIEKFHVGAEKQEHLFYFWSVSGKKAWIQI